MIVNIKRTHICKSHLMTILFMYICLADRLTMLIFNNNPKINSTIK